MSDVVPGDEGTLLHGYLGVIRSRKWSVLIVALVAAVGAYLFAQRQTPIYQSVGTVQATNPTGAITAGGFTGVVMPTEQAIVTSQDVADCAWLLFELKGTPEKRCGADGVLTEEFKASAPPQEFLSKVAVSVPTGTTLLTIAYNHQVPQRAQAGARSYARAYVWAKTFEAEVTVAALRQPLLDEKAELEATVAELTAGILEAAEAGDNQQIAALSTQLQSQSSRLNSVQQFLLETDPTQIDPPEIIADPLLPAEPASPNIPLITAFGILAGIAFGVGQALLREQLDRRLRGRTELEERIGAPVLAVVPTIPHWRSRKKPRLVTVESPKSEAAEAYRTLRTSVLFQASQRGIRSLGVTSAFAAEGKSVTSANLAVALADAGKRVILVSCDLRKARAHEFFGLSNAVGLSNILMEEATLSDALQETERPNLRMIASGPQVDAPAELLHSAPMAELVQQMLADCDLLVLDTAPLLPVADTLALAPLVDSVLFVADASKTSGYAITQARQVLGQLRVPISGAVLNNYDPSKARGTLAGRYGYGYGYGYGRSAPPLEPSVDGGRPVPQPAVPPTGAAPANGGERVTPQVPPRP